MDSTLKQLIHLVLLEAFLPNKEEEEENERTGREATEPNPYSWYGIGKRREMNETERRVSQER